MNTDLENLKLPLGKFAMPSLITKELLAEWISDISRFPTRLKIEVSTLSDTQLDTPYRPDGWTVRQVVNHCADSHINAFIRVKLALTEDNPTTIGYHQDLWAMLPDSKNNSIDAALKIIEGLHERWSVLLNNLTGQELERTFFHPGQKRNMSISENIALYAWHSNHHLAHITSLKKREGWK